MRCEHQHVADVFVDAIAAAFLTHKIARQPFCADIGGDVFRVAAFARHLYGFGVEIGGVNFHPEVVCVGLLRNGFFEDDGE